MARDNDFNGDAFEQSIRAKVQIAEKIQDLEKKTGHEVTEEDFHNIMAKVVKIQDGDEIKKKKKKILKNTVEQDFAKGSVRNQKCPICKAKLKKCICGFLL